MDVTLKNASLDCYHRSFTQHLRKEETQDSVVPDTLPDIGEVLCTGGSLLIRSKDVSTGRVKIEANVPAKVVYCAEESGEIYSIDVNVPVFLSAEDEGITDGSFCTAEVKLIALETRVLNPRKVLVKAEVCADVCCYEKASLQYISGVEGEEHIHVSECCRDISLFSAVTEKTFALTDELALPGGMSAEGILSCQTEALADDVKQVGSKLIVKGRVKSSMLILSGEGLMETVEHTTDFSQIIESGHSAEDGCACVWLMPSGTYHYISSESNSCISMEFHLVAQVLCYEKKKACCLDDAYSNTYSLELGFKDIVCEKISVQSILRENLRQLYELQNVSEIVSCSCMCGKLRISGGKAELPVAVQCVYRDGEGKCRSVKYCPELSFDSGTKTDERLWVKGVEITECCAAVVPGGIELRVSAQLDVCIIGVESFSCISAVAYDETQPLDNSTKPSIVLLRAKAGDDLWTLARENCSTVEAIIEANHLDEAEGAWEKLILIPKTF